MTDTDFDTPPKTLLSINEATQALSLSRSAIYLLLGRGDLIALKVGKRTLIPTTSVQALVARLPTARFAGAKPAHRA